MKRCVFLVLLAAALAAPVARADTGPDYVASDNVKLLGEIKTVGDGVGARIVGPYLYVTTTKSLTIFDIKTDPEHPKPMGSEVRDVEFENEEVPTNGKLLGISGQIGCPDPTASNILATNSTYGQGSNATGCLTLFDVSDPNNVKQLTSVAGAGQHTSTCVLDCQWLYGSSGAITDARDPAHAKLVGNWQDGLPNLYTDPETGKQSKFSPNGGCHHLREIQPGIILGSCQPIILMSVRPEDGGSVMRPVVLDTGNNQEDRFIHSGRWPNAGTDKFLLLGGETNFKPTCDDTRGAFMVWDATAVRDGNGGFNKGQKFKMLSEVRASQGTYADGHTPYNALGCSVHWFEEHPSFHDGGLVALAEYENGERFLQILPNGKIVEQGYFLPLGGATSAPHWNPYDPSIVYSIDYERGVDVLKYTGSTYVPGADQTGTPGTADQAKRDAIAPSAACAAAAGFTGVSARRSRRGLRLGASLSRGKTFDVTLSQVSRGRALLKSRRVARFTGRRRAFTWRGTRGLRDGYYVARFSTRYGKGSRDVRTVALQRRHGRFVAARDYTQGRSCGMFSGFSLSAPVFGGSRNRSLKIRYTLRRAAQRVRIQALVGKKVVRSFAGGGTSGKTYRFTLPARRIKRGALVRIRATVDQGPPVATETLYARRL